MENPRSPKKKKKTIHHSTNKPNITHQTQHTTQSHILSPQKPGHSQFSLTNARDTHKYQGHTRDLHEPDPTGDVNHNPSKHQNYHKHTHHQNIPHSNILNESTQLLETPSQIHERFTRHLLDHAARINNTWSTHCHSHKNPHIPNTQEQTHYEKSHTGTDTQP